jgi:hypothetical protein
LFEDLSDGMKYFENLSKHIVVHWTPNRSYESMVETL